MQTEGRVTTDLTALFPLCCLDPLVSTKRDPAHSKVTLELTK